MSPGDPFEVLAKQGWSADSELLAGLFRRLHCLASIYTPSYDEASEIAQRAQQKGWKEWEKCKGRKDKKKVEAWFGSIVRNEAMSFLRSRQSHPSSSLDALLNEEALSEICEYIQVRHPDELPDVHLEQKEECLEHAKRCQLTTQAFYRCSIEHRQYLHYLIIEEKKQKEVAVLLGCSERTVRRYLTAAVQELRQHYRELSEEQSLMEGGSDL